MESFSVWRTLESTGCFRKSAIDIKPSLKQPFYSFENNSGKNVYVEF
jgi:hypothetical protein